MDLSDVWTTL